MKAISNMLWIAIVFFTMPSCKKSIALENETIIGKWREVQTFNGYINDGNYSWENKPAYTYRTIEFKPDGKFIERSGSAEDLKVCSGDYKTFSGNKLNISSPCDQEATSFVISQQTSSGLIIDRQVKDGIVRERFMRIYNY